MNWTLKKNPISNLELDFNNAFIIKLRTITNGPLSNHSCIKEQKCEDENNRIALIGIKTLNIKALKSYSIGEKKIL